MSQKEIGMNASTADETLTRLSLLDRLIDEDPTVSSEVPLNKAQRSRTMQNCIRRDLEDLLNTRYRCVSWPPELNELENSLINYGIPDFTAAGLGIASDVETMIAAIQRALEIFEPRLQDIRVSNVSRTGSYDRTLCFRIEAVLWLEDERVSLKYESEMESTTGKFDVK